MSTKERRGNAPLGGNTMSEAAAQPAPGLPQTLEGLAALLGDLAAENRGLFEEAVRISRAPMSQDDRNVVIMLVHRAADVEGIERAVLDKLNQEVRLRTVQELWEKTAPQPELAPAPVPESPRRARPAGHRKAGDRHLKGLPGWVAVPLAATGAALRHSWAAHPVATAVAGTAAAVTLTAGAVVGPHTAATFGGTTATAPSTGITSATPIISPSQIAAVLHPEGGIGTALTVVAPPTVPSYTQPAYMPPPDGGQGQGSQQQDSAPQVSLIVTGSLDLGVGSSGVIRLTAFGGPVSWQASASAAGMNLDQASGVLSPGHSATITVSIIADLQALAGPGSVTITYGGGKTAVVRVSWSVIPLPVPVESALPSLPDVLPSVSVP